MELLLDDLLFERYYNMVVVVVMVTQILKRNQDLGKGRVLAQNKKRRRGHPHMCTVKHYWWSIERPIIRGGLGSPRLASVLAGITQNIFRRCRAKERSFPFLPGRCIPP